MTAEELIKFTGQQNRVRSIKRIVQIDDRHWQSMYLDVIYHFAEIIQLMPASQAHHHAVPGGLLIHTLEVIEQAMNLRQKYTLPAFAEQEVQNRERHVWSYAVFVAAILHDVGKRITMCQFICDDDKAHSPFDKPISETGKKYYKLVFLDTKYHAMHEQIGLTLIDIIPSIGKSFLFSHLNIIKEMMSYIHGEKRKDNIIAEIIQLADQKSTGASLLHSPTHKFKGASIENMGQRIMTQLRQMIASNNFPINKANANIYTTKDGHTYGVSKIIVDGIREEMAKNNETDIPADNNRIFDIFQEYGLAEINPRTGKLIHTICIYHNGSTRVFTVLKFKTEKLFMTVPPNFEGIIEEVANKNIVQQPSTPIGASLKPSTPEAENETPVVSEAENSISNAGADDPFAKPATDIKVSLLENETNDNTGTEIHTTAKSPQGDNESESTTKKLSKPAPVKDVSELDQKLASDFMDWCREQIIKKKIVINESSGQIQKVKFKGTSVIAVVTPRIFSEFAQILGLPNPKDKGTFTKIQSAIHKAKLNIPAPRGQIHVFKILKSLNNPMGGNIKIRHYLFTIDNFCEDNDILKAIVDTVEDNKNLTNT
ncbi:MAG: MobH family relaxase [Ostreibacterium sp.]